MLVRLCPCGHGSICVCERDVFPLSFENTGTVVAALGKMRQRETGDKVQLF